MVLVSDEVEFRRVSETTGKNGGTNYYYTFEDDKGSFQVFSRQAFDLKKGEKTHIIFETRLWDNRLQFNMIGVQAK